LQGCNFAVKSSIDWDLLQKETELQAIKRWRFVTSRGQSVEEVSQCTSLGDFFDAGIGIIGQSEITEILSSSEDDYVSSYLSANPPFFCVDRY
jgi:hypothetical protein